MNTMSLFYDPEVLYKNNLIFHFMNFNENLRNLRERKNINRPQHEKLCLRAIILVLAKQRYAECMMYLESVTLYLTRFFHLFCELWPLYYMNPTDVIVLKNDVKVA